MTALNEAKTYFLESERVGLPFRVHGSWPLLLRAHDAWVPTGSRT
jgi:hypothetical protein